MVRLATFKDMNELAYMLRSMTEEVFGDKAAKSPIAYTNTIKRHLIKDKIYVDGKLRGFAILEDATEAITPNLKRIIISRAYIKPSARNKTVYGRIYHKIISDYPDYEIVGMTEINSPHIPILDKHQELIAKVYRRKK